METRVCRLYGQKNLKIEKEQVPAIGANEVLVRVERGGICGSDLHYYLHGGFGPIRVREPIIMGHEFAGRVIDIGSEVDDLEKGDAVGINPSRPCGICKYCQQDLLQHCTEMKFFGSAMKTPHEQGGFREYFVIPRQQCVKAINGDVEVAQLACAEPLAVCLHAASQVKLSKNQNVLVNGSGPIGALCIAVAKYYGVTHVVVTDIYDKPLEVARTLGVDETLNLRENEKAIKKYAMDKGQFDIIFECSAAPSAMPNLFQVIKPQGTIVQVGVSGAISFPLNLMVSKEVRWIGSHRFHSEYQQAVALIDRKEINVRPIITNTFPIKETIKAFETAADRSCAIKVQIDFTL